MLASNYDPFGVETGYDPTGGVGVPTRGTPSPMAGWTPQPQQGAGGYFDDPLTQPLMESWTRRMDQLRAPGPDYGADFDRLEGLFGTDPRYDTAINSLLASMKRKAPTNAYTGQYARNVGTRIGELRADPYSDADEAAIKVRFFDKLARDRGDAQDQLRERLATMGFAPTSGAVAQAEVDLEGNYETARAGQQQRMLEYVTDERNRRRDLAVQMSGGLADAGARDAALAAQWEGQRASNAGTAAQLLAARQAQQIGLATQMAQLTRQRYLDDMTRGGEELEVSALPASLAQQRMAQLQQILSGLTPNPQSLYEQQLARERMGMEADARSDANRQALWGTIGQVATPLLTAWLNNRGSGGGGG